METKVRAAIEGVALVLLAMDWQSARTFRRNNDLHCPWSGGVGRMATIKS